MESVKAATKNALELSRKKYLSIFSSYSDNEEWYVRRSLDELSATLQLLGSQARESFASVAGIRAQVSDLRIGRDEIEERLKSMSPNFLIVYWLLTK